MGDRIFVDDEASDSDVSLTSTAPSEARSEYPVDRILAEELVPPDSEYGDEDEDQVQYLVKWSGYPISRSTWEPRQNFNDEASLIAWERRKQREQQGLEEPFDVDKFIEDIHKIEAKTERRKAKREAKREERRILEELAAQKRRRLAVEELAAKKRKQEVWEELTAKKRKQRALEETTPRKRRKDAPKSDNEPGPGSNDEQVASNSSDRPAATPSISLGSSILSKPRKTSIATASSAPVEPPAINHESDSEEDMVATLQRRSSITAQVPAEKIARPAQGNITKSAAAESAPAAGDSEHSAPSKKDSRPSNGHSSKSAVARPAVAASQRFASDKDNARLSEDHTSKSVLTRPAPATSERSVPAKVFTADWNKSKKKDHRSRLDNATTMEGRNSAFERLSIANKVSKWASSERAPDPSVLLTFNHETGTWEKPTQPPQSEEHTNGSAPPGGPDALPRGAGTHSDAPSSLPSALRKDTNSIGRSVGFDVPAQPSMPSAPPLSKLGENSAVTSRTAQADARKKQWTCPHWRKGRCRFSESVCEFAHSDTALGIWKQDQVCDYWKRGKCKWSEEDCEYLHAQPRNMQKSSRVCPYWERGWCRHAGSCKDLHGTLQELPAQATRGQEKLSVPVDTRRPVSPDGPGRRQGDVERPAGRRDVSTGDVAKRQDIIERLKTQGRTNSVAASNETEKKTAELKPSPSLAGPGKFLQRSSISSPEPCAVRTSESPPVVSSHTSKDVSIITRGPELPVSLTLPVADGEAMTLDVRLSFESGSNFLAALNPLGSEVKLDIRSMCLAHDFQHFCHEPEQALSIGDVRCEKDKELFESFKDHLLSSEVGAVVRNERYLMVVFPANGPWTFLADSDKHSSMSGLQFYIQATTDREFEVDSINGLASDCSLNSLCERQLDLNKRQILTYEKDNTIIKSVFLMFPSRVTPEALIITAWLLENGASVYHADAPGAWDQYQVDQKTFSRPGTIIFHPSLDLYGHIIYFSWVLIGPSKIFQVGSEPAEKNLPKSSKNGDTAYSCVRLFPSGGLTLVTDEVFEYHPGSAARVLEIRERGFSNKSGAVSHERLIARPGLEDWLLDLIQKYKSEDDSTTRRERLRLYHVVSRLPTGTIGDAVNEDDPPLLLSPPTSEFEDYFVKWDTDEEAATDWLAEWFQGECALAREQYRRFMVVHEERRSAEQTPGQRTEKDPRGWARKFRHLKVLTCDGYCEPYERR